MEAGSGEWARAGIAAIVLAAGRSRRMGAQSKLLLPHPRNGQPLLRHTVEAVLALEPLATLVVVRPDQPELAAALAGLPVEIISNPDFAAGLSTSLRAGIAALAPGVAAALVLLGDTPAVAPPVLAAVLAAYLAHGTPITIPVYGGVPGPPTLFSRAAFPAIAALTGDHGGLPLVHAHPTWVTPVALPAALQPADIDTPADYQAFLRDP